MLQNRVGEPKSFKQRGLFNTLLLLVLVSSAWGSFEDFKRKQNESFTKYKDEKDAAFSRFLTLEWEAYKAKAPKPLYEKPKPKELPQTQPTKIKELGPMVFVKLKEEVKELPKITIKEKDLLIDFYGKELGFGVDESIKKAKFSPQTQAGVANFFTTAANAKYENILSDLKAYKEGLSLNDWALYLLTQQLSHKVFSNENDAKLLTWFLLSKLGYNVKVGIAAQQVHLLHHSKKIIYSTPRYTFDAKEFYLLEDYAKKSQKRIYTYKQDYPNATKDLDLSLKKLPLIGEKRKQKELKFKRQNQDYTIAFSYNEQLMAFMQTYPQADYETFFNAPMEAETYASVAKGLKGYIDGKKASDALNFILHFVQSAFVYQIDQEQFGREKVMFAQETLVYDRSDCEDRSVLYAYLVKKLFKIGVVGVKYSDHMATALHVPMSGDTLSVANTKLIIADPTYVNANIGQSMPRYKSIMPQSFIFVEKDEG